MGSLRNGARRGGVLNKAEVRPGIIHLDASWIVARVP